jgi:peptide/nickel transport system permease protein
LSAALLLNRLRRLTASRALLAGSALLLTALVLAVAARLLYPGDPLDIVGPAAVWPGADTHFPLGTDMMGRDMAAGLMHAARVSLIVGLTAAALSLLMGVLIGAAAGYFGGWADDVLMRFTEMFQTMPAFLFAIVIIVILGPSVTSIAFAIGITSWPQIARLTRAEALRLRSTDFVLAAETIGMPHWKIILSHVLPNSLAPIIVATSVLIAQAILTEASLSFLGLGDPNVISWGSMVGAGRSSLRTAWYMTALPGSAIFIVVMGFMLLGNGLNDLLNPRTARR